MSLYLDQSFPCEILEMVPNIKESKFELIILLPCDLCYHSNGFLLVVPAVPLNINFDKIIPWPDTMALCWSDQDTSRIKT